MDRLAKTPHVIQLSWSCVTYESSPSPPATPHQTVASPTSSPKPQLMRILLFRRLWCLSGAATSGQASGWTTQAVPATTGPLSATIAPALTPCTSIQAESTPRTASPGTSVNPSAVSPSAVAYDLLRKPHKTLLFLHLLIYNKTQIVSFLYILFFCYLQFTRLSFCCQGIEWLRHTWQNV